MKRGFSVSEVAKRLGYSKNSIYGFLKGGTIKAVRIGKGKFRIPEEEIDRFETQSDPPSTTESVQMSAVLSTPRPGKSLADLSGESTWHMLQLWFGERVGLPKLFDWLTCLTAVILGLSLFLYSNQHDVLSLGSLSVWMNPIRLGLIFGGLGLVLAVMIQGEVKGYANLTNYFRVLLTAVFAGLAAALLVGKDLDGFLMYGMFAVVILVHAMTSLKTSTLYMFYITGLILGCYAILVLLPDWSGLSVTVSAITKLFRGFEWILGLLVFTTAVLGLYGYFINRNFLKKLLFIYGVLLCLAAVLYGLGNYWSRAYTVLIAGVVGLLMPFWEEFKAKTVENRPLAFQLFGLLFLTFFVSMTMVAAVQGSLIDNAYKALSDKAEFAKAEYVHDVESIMIGASNLVENKNFLDAYTNGQYQLLKDQFKYFSLGGNDVGFVGVVNAKGKILASNPSSSFISTANVSDEEYFTKVYQTGTMYVSKHLERVSEAVDDMIVVAVPFSTSKGITGILVVGLSGLSESEEMVRIAEPTLEQEIMLIGDHGLFLAHPEIDRIGTKVLESDGVYDLWRNGNAKGQGYSWSGAFAIFAATSISEYGITIVASEPVRSVLSLSAAWLVWLMIISCVVAVIGLIYFYYRDVKIKET